ncbi:hypothetical protein HYT26_03315 [Candidatus Pacearchaeota archaeon]|nr:hypothetical protein [Candidatus Pacearchaeota archaeon]
MPEKKDYSIGILKSSRDAGKTYDFDEKHNKDLPVGMWFQNSHEGTILFIVFYTQACRWSRCLGCNLPSKSSQYNVDYRALIKQIDYVFASADVIGQRERIKKVIVSNNGSVLDEETFSSTALMYLLAKLNLHLPNLAVCSIETRAEYVDLAELEFISRVIKEGETPTELELAIGFEAFDESIRNRIFKKGLSLKLFESFVGRISPYQYGLKCYFMQKPVPGMSDEEAILDIQHGIDYLSRIASIYEIKINMHLNPTFVAKGTPLEKSFLKGKYTPPRLIDVAKAALHAEGARISVFIGLYDEGLAVKGGSFVRENDKGIVHLVEQFNMTGNFRFLHLACKE